MHQKFSYSHTIRTDDQHIRQIIQNQKKNTNNQNNHQSDSDDYDQLFKIGNKSIINNQRNSSQEHSHSQSKQNKNKHIYKQKKVKKEKKEKKDKKVKKEKSHKKQNKKNKQKHIHISQSDSQTPIIQKKVKILQNQNEEMLEQDAMAKLQRKMQLLNKYEKQLTLYRTPQQDQKVLDKQFGLKEKISQNSLPIDIIKFGLPEIETYGLQDRQIPFYKRDPMLKTIIGMKKKKKKILKILRELNITTAQLGIDWKKYQSTSTDRYFHYQGYQKIIGQTIQKYIMKAKKYKEEQVNQPIYENGIVINYANSDNLQLAVRPKTRNPQPIKQIVPNILFSPPIEQRVYLETKQQKLLAINKEYNISLNQYPNNINLWLKFINLQDKLTQLTQLNSQTQTSIHQKTSLIERKLSILLKSLQKNPNNLHLGLQQINLMLESNKQRKQIESVIQSLVQQNPQNLKLWQTYFQFKINNLINYNHHRLQKQYQDVNISFQNKINHIQSSQQIINIKKCAIYLLASILKIHRLQGYYELSTAICIALLEFNIFCGKDMLEKQKQDKIIQFRQYWENYSGYKIGEFWFEDQNKQEIQNNFIEHSWEGHIKRSHNPQQSINKPNPKQYIASYLLPSPNNTSKQFLPSHSLFSLQRIKTFPESFILFEDIQIYLQEFRNEQNLKQLINISIKNLSMPQIFHTNASQNFQPSAQQNQYIIQWFNSIGQNPLKSPYHQHTFTKWNEYWHPELTKQFLSCTNEVQGINKFIYALNLTHYLKLKYIINASQSPFISKLNQYLMFLYGTIYHLHADPKESNPNISHLLQIFPQAFCLNKIQQLLTNQPSNINLWTMYIEYQILSGKSVRECVEVYLHCYSMLGENGNVADNVQNLSNITNQSDIIIIKKLSILYELSQFFYRHGPLPSPISTNNTPNSRNIVLRIMKQTLLPPAEQQIEPERLTLQNLMNSNFSISSMQKLLMGNKLKNLLKIPNTNQSILYCMLLQLGQSPSTLLIPLLSLPANTISPSPTDILINYNLLELDHIKQFQILSKYSNIKNIQILTYFNRKILSQCNGILSGFYNIWNEYFGTIRVYSNPNNNSNADNYYEQSSSNKLYLWLIAMRVLQPEHIFCPTNPTTTKIHETFIEYFLNKAKKQIANNNEPSCMQILNKLIKSSQFSYNWLSQLPYCRQLYLIAMQQDSNDVNNGRKAKIQRLVLEKQIRLNLQNL